MRIEIYYGVGEKSKVMVQGDIEFIDIAKICKEFLETDIGYRLEIYRN